MTVFNASILDSKLVKENGGTTDKTDQAENFLNGPNLAGSGPYMITSVERTSQIILSANPMYWGPQPKYSKIILHNAPPATQSLDVQDGQAQIAVDILPTQATNLNSTVNVIAAPTSDAVNLWMSINPKVSSLSSNQDFRNAVRLGLDYQGILALEGKGAVEGTGFLPQGFLGSLPASEAPQRDLAQAKAALAKVGVANPTITLEYPTDFIVDGVQPATIVAKIQSDLKEVGITVNLSGKPSAVDISEAVNGKYAMWFCPNSADYPDPSDFGISVPGGLVASGFGNATGVNPNLDALVTAAQSAIQPADRETAYQALARAINTKGYTTMLFQPSRVLVTAKSVHATINPFTYLDFASIT
jgi:peptide/nickel transport system substrate-binding protein